MAKNGDRSVEAVGMGKIINPTRNYDCGSGGGTGGAGRIPIQTGPTNQLMEVSQQKMPCRKPEFIPEVLGNITGVSSLKPLVHIASKFNWLYSLKIFKI